MQKNKTIINVLLIIAANALLAMASALFFLPLGIVNGGMNGVSIIVLEWFDLPVEITTALLAWGFFFLGLLFLGKRFSAQTLVATIVYPIVFFLLVRFDGPSWIGFQVEEETHRLIAAIMGGSLVGVGMGLSFLAGGSTGGFDVLMLLFQRFFEWKASVTSFLIDAVIILLGMFTFGIINGFYGIIATVLTSVMIEVVFAGLSRVYLVNIISSKSKEINQFIGEKLERGSTIFLAKGGYQQKPLEVIQVAILRREYFLLKDQIASLDPQAFVIINQARTVLGLGFHPLKMPLPNLFQKKEKQA